MNERIFVNMANPKRPKDANQRAKFILDIIEGEKSLIDPNEGKNQNAVALGRLGGLKGGTARKNKLSPARRKEIASKASKKRWAK